jgi:amiloride-sensitive sodium channel
MVHAVSEFPQVSSQFVHLPLDSTVSVAVRPDMVTTAPGLQEHDPTVRGCYFPDERKLDYFKV